jgi:hypothetical protein
MRTPRVLVPVAAALAVLAVVVVVALWPSEGTAPSGAGSAPASSAVVGGTGSPGPAQTATVSPLPSDGSLTGSATAARAVGWTAQGTRLRVAYSAGAPTCSGRVQPEVVERADAVVVTLHVQPPHVASTQACPDLAVLTTVDIALDAPVGDRPVLDGGYGEQPVPHGLPAGAGLPVR